jgi:hypothetical protein
MDRDTTGSVDSESASDPEPPKKFKKAENGKNKNFIVFMYEEFSGRPLLDY